MKEKIILIGGGGHCKSCIDVIELEGKFEIAAIIDLEEKKGSTILDYKIEFTDSDLESLIEKYENVLITLGQIKSPSLRIKYYELAKSFGANFPIIISPLAHVSKHSEIGEGTIIMTHALINADTKIGINSIINSKALIEHDVKIGDHCHISTASIVNGHTTVGDQTFIGSNTVLRENVSISANQVISAGTKIMKDL